MTTIKFCPLNFTNELTETKQRLEDDTTAEIVQRRCLNYCGQCIVQPFAIVNGKGVFCDHPEELYPAIRQALLPTT